MDEQCPETLRRREKQKNIIFIKWFLVHSNCAFKI